MRWPRLLHIALPLLVACSGLAACGGDGGNDEEDISEVIKQLITSEDVKIECEERVTEDFVKRVYGDVAQCRIAERPKPGEDSAEDARVSGVKVDGDSATAKVRYIGGDSDGSRGTLELRKQDGDWKVDDVGIDLLRSTVNASLETQAQSQELLRKPEVRRCARKAFDDLSDAEFRRVAYASVSERAGSDEAVGKLIAPCLALSGSGSGSDSASLLREKFEEGVTRTLRRRGASQALIDCINRRLRRTISEEEIIASAGSRSATARMRRSAQQAARACQ